MLTVLGILVLLVLPSVIGLVHDRHIDRQIREAERARRETEGQFPKALQPARQSYFTRTVTHHS